MVTFNVAQFLQEPLGSIRYFDFDEPIADDEQTVSTKGPVSGRAKLSLTSRGVLVQAKYAASVVQECARCLDELELPIEGRLDEEFLPAIDLRSGAPKKIKDDLEDPETLHVSEEHEIELDEVLRQDILTRLPMRPLCEPDCPGLCETCGSKRDASHRAHAESDPVPEASQDTHQPFAALAELLKQKNGESD